MRLCGIETEYGFQVEGRDPSTQLDDASAFVACVAGITFNSWDYAPESPRRDLRGFEAKELSTDPEDARWDSDRQAGSRETRTDRVLVNGARFYNDHGHPEYATPECAKLVDLVAHDLAGERVVWDAAARYASEVGRKVVVYKNNTDFHGASYGTHESYRVERSIQVESLMRGLIPFFVSRQILTGAGKASSEKGRPAKFQLSQRADFMSEVASVDTLYRRPIFNTRDESHDDDSKWMRLHVICGDANRMQWATAMKAGMSSIVIDLIRDGLCPKWDLCTPVRAFESVSKDNPSGVRLELSNSSWTDAIELTDSYLSAAEKAYDRASAETTWILSEWRRALEDYRVEPMRLRDRVDWAAKKFLLDQFEGADGNLSPNSAMSLDLQYHSLDPEESLFAAYAELEPVAEVVSEQRILDSMTMPPPTRAAKRAAAVLNPKGLTAIGWLRAVYEHEGTRRVVIWDTDEDSS